MRRRLLACLRDGAITSLVGSGRRITNLTSCYFTFSRRYVCRGCEKTVQEAKQKAKDAAEDAGLQCEEVDAEE